MKPLLSYGIARGNLEFDGAKSALGESELPYSHLCDSLPDSPIERISEVFFQARVR